MFIKIKKLGCSLPILTIKLFINNLILFIITIPKFFVLAITFSQKLLSRISFRGFKQFDFLTRAFHAKASLINISG